MSFPHRSHPCLRLFFFVLTVGTVLCAGAQSDGAIEDGLKDPALWKFDSAKWSFRDGILSQTNALVTLNAELRPTDYRAWEGFIASVRVRLDPGQSASAGGWAGLSIKGVNYSLRVDGAYATYRNKKTGGYDGTFEKLSAPPGHWFEIRVITQGDKIKGFLDGRPWLALVAAPAPDVGVSLVGARLAVDFRDFSVTPLWENEAAELAMLGSGKNRLENSSFEAVVEDLPPTWRQHTAIHAWTNENDYFDSFTVVTNGAWHGDRCVQLYTKDPAQPAGLMRMDASDLGNQPGTFSVYLKASATNTLAAISLDQDRIEVRVGPEWTRYSITTPKPRDKAKPSVHMCSVGTIWVDAAQLETGTVATAYDAGAAYSEETFLRPTQLRTASPVRVYPTAWTTTPITLDGVLDEACWQQATSLDLRLCGSGAAPQESASGRIAFDAENLYVALTCQADADRNIPTNAAARQTPWHTDSVELLLDPTGGRQTAFQFAANLAGARASSKGRFGTSTFQNTTSNWACAGSRTGGSYSIEMKIPLAALDLDARTPRRWPINLARSNLATSEFACSSPTRAANFHEIENYDEIELPEALDLTRFAVAHMKATASKSNSTAKPPLLVYPSLSFFSDEPLVTLVGELSDAAGLSGERRASARLLLDDQEVMDTEARFDKNLLRFEFPRQPLAPGRYEAIVDVHGGGFASLTGRCDVVIRTPIAGETKIDHERRCIVIDGHPTVVFMPLVTTYHGLTDRFWQLFADHDIRNMMIAPGRPHLKMVGDILDQANRFGINILYFCGVDTNAVQRPNLLGWLVVDEPIGELQATQMVATVERAYEQDPQHVIYCNHMPHTMAANYAGLPGDIISIDYYPMPVPGRSIREIGAMTRQMEEFALPRRLPTWFFVQGSGLHGREPTARELEAQTYEVLVNGGTGVQFFFGLPHGRRAWERFVTLAQEVRQLNDVLLSLNERPTFVQTRPEEITATSRRLDGATYILAVNSTRDSHREAFAVPGVTGRVEVLFEDRSIPIVNSKFQDEFEPLQRHVYRLPPASENK